MLGENVYGKIQNGSGTPKKILVYYYVRHFLKKHHLIKYLRTTKVGRPSMNDTPPLS